MNRYRNSVWSLSLSNLLSPALSQTSSTLCYYLHTLSFLPPLLFTFCGPLFAYILWSVSVMCHRNWPTIPKKNCNPTLRFSSGRIGLMDTCFVQACRNLSWSDKVTFLITSRLSMKQRLPQSNGNRSSLPLAIIWTPTTVHYRI